MVTNFSTNVMKLLKFKISDYDDPARTSFTATQFRWIGNWEGFDPQHQMFLIGGGRLRFVYPGSGSYSEMDVDAATSNSGYTMEYVYPIQERGYNAGISYAVSGTSEVRTLFAGNNLKEFMTNTGKVPTKVRMGVVMPDNQDRTCLVYEPLTESVVVLVRDRDTNKHSVKTSSTADSNPTPTTPS